MKKDEPNAIVQIALIWLGAIMDHIGIEKFMVLTKPLTCGSSRDQCWETALALVEMADGNEKLKPYIKQFCDVAGLRTYDA